MLIYDKAIVEEKTYWLSRLSGELGSSALPADAPRQGADRGQQKTLTLPLHAALWDKLQKICKQSDQLLHTLLTAGAMLLVHRYAGQETPVVGTLSLREGGQPANLLPVRQSVEEAQTFRGFLGQLRTALIEAYKHSRYPHQRLALDLGLEMREKASPLFDLVVVLDSIHDVSALVGAQHGMVFRFTRTEDALLFALDYNAAQYSQKTAEQAARHFLHLLEQATGEPDGLVGDLALLDDVEKEQLLYSFNRTAAEYPREKLLHEWFAEQAAKTPEETAVVCGAVTWTYRELAERAAQFARFLQSRVELARDVRIGLLMERTPQLFAAMIGILQAGAAYVPLDPSLPRERIKAVLADAGIEWMASSTGQLETLVALQEEGALQHYVCLDAEEWKQEIPQTESTAAYAQDSSQLAYVIYTSGSTGVPKGVMIEHRTVANFIQAMHDRIEFTPGKSVVALTSISFDIFVLESWVPLLNGLRIVLADEEQQRDPKLLSELISEQNVDILQTTPSRMQQLLAEESTRASLSGLSELIIGGEAFPDLLQSDLRRLVQAKIYNAYGPTETTVWSTLQDLTGQETVDIGTPIHNTSVLILDAKGRLQPIGVAGELCIAGDGLARGYLNRPDLTAAAFVEHPFQPGTRLYKTGDLARWLQDGRIEHLGRIDLQVKIRGYRIELTEIESRLLQQPEILEAAVMPVEESGGQKALAAYYVPADGEELPVAMLRERLASHLPDYMIPAYFLPLAVMPLTTSGKINRKALPAPSGPAGKSSRSYTAPRNEREQELAAIWEAVLGLTPIGIDDHFFELGGHSLKITMLASKIHQRFHVEVPMKTFFEHPTIRGLAAYMDSAQESVYTGIVKVEEQPYYPVSSPQKRMLILQQLEAEQTIYNMPRVMRVAGELDLERFRGVLAQLTERHETLRTGFEWVNGEPVQRVHQTVELHIEHDTDPAGTDAEIIRRFVRPFDLEKPPLLRLGFAKRPDDSYLLLFDMHHIISDGMSIDILVQEFTRLYAGEKLPPLPVQYKDFSAWQNEAMRSGTGQRQEEFWLERFSGEIPVLNLPTDNPRPTVQNFAGHAFTFAVGRELTELIKKQVAESGTTLYMFLLAAYQLLLAKYSGQEDIVVASPIAGRSHADVQGIIGMFVNTLAMRNQPVPQLSWRDYLAEVRDRALQAYEHQDYPLEELIDKLQIKRDLSRNPLFDTMFVLHNLDIKELAVESLKIEPYPFEGETTKFELTVLAMEAEGGLQVEFEYSTKLFAESTMRRMSGHFLHLLQTIVEHPDRRLGELTMLPEAEQQQILHDFNQSGLAVEAGGSIHSQFERNAAADPDKTALVFGDLSLSYGELNTRANQAARALRQKGVGQGSRVGLIMERSPEMIIGMLAALKAGGAYVPIDPEYPLDRIEYLLQDCQPDAVLTQSHLADRLQAVLSGELLLLDDADLYNGAGENLPPLCTEEDLAYLIYTSGSTGLPKGVMIEHRTVNNLIAAYQAAYGLSAEHTILAQSSISFDASVIETVLALAIGMRIVVTNEAEHRDPALLLDLIGRQGIDVLHATPSRMQMLTADTVHRGVLSRLQIVLLGGEALPQHLVHELRGLTAARLFNAYGPTEATVCSTMKEVTHDDAVTIGRPIGNYRAYIVDGQDNLQPVGVVGELCIAGPVLARGYWNRPELTVEKFVRDPFASSGRMYRTGDLAKWLPNGEIQYIGRIDHQVKIRGYRIEMGEIETQLLQIDGVTQAAVIDLTDDQGANYLCAYVVGNREFTVSELREALAAKLAAYQIPAHFVQLAELPLTPNGKVHRSELPMPDGSMSLGVEYLPPTDELEAILALIWQEVLGAEQVGIKDNFFELGGDSIKAIQVSARLHEHRLKLNMPDLFQYPTIETLRPRLQMQDRAIDQGPVAGIVPLTPAQHWFFSQKLTNAHHWNQAVMLHRPDGFDADIVQMVFAKMLEHHDALRLVFTTQGDGVVQINQGLDQAAVELEAFELADADRLQSSFDLQRGPLLKLGLARTDEGDHLLIILHHLIVDGVSWRILLEDFVTGYTQALAGETISFPLKTDSFLSWAEHLQSYAGSKELQKEKAYWAQIESTSAAGLPKDRHAATNRMQDSAIATAGLTPEETELLLKQANRAYNTEINDLLLTALGLAVQDWAGLNSVPVSLEGHGREDLDSNLDISRTVGWFTSIFPVLLQLEPGKDLGYLLKSVKENMRRIPNKGAGYGVLKYLAASGAQQPEQTAAHAFAPEISFNYLGQFDQTLQTDVFAVSEAATGDVISPASERHTALNINGMTAGGVFQLSVNYNALEYDPATIDKLLGLYLQHLRAILEHCTQKEDTELTPTDLGDDELSLEEFADLSDFISGLSL
ncbi:hypothetical protein CBW65_06755 [Tumebacillus avium]|uniref:Carrier domain-containing protein n=1 Tax=Tumebacillus avium TaxID=1903704 RepID=A0A1Y0ILZ3_9BACL|nr:non-ribosomal peptide synthetase [Tumebacillus avium]ARU60826.1 hypothetical protein CBW65_06755 [Tumebacillus avium]